LDDGDVGILHSPLSFPGADDIKQKIWEFCPCPCPLSDPPPIPNNVFLHYLNSPRTHPRATWLNRLPKKLGSSIHQNSEPFHVGCQVRGWGIHVVEGPNGRAMFWLTLTAIISSSLGAVLYAGLTRDVQSAFSIAGFVLAAFGTIMFAVFNYSPMNYAQR
jgi:hypothetical protein